MIVRDQCRWLSAVRFYQRSAIHATRGTYDRGLSYTITVCSAKLITRTVIGNAAWYL